MKLKKLESEKFKSFEDDKLSNLKNLRGGAWQDTYYSEPPHDMYNDDTAHSSSNGDFYWLLPEVVVYG